MTSSHQESLALSVIKQGMCLMMAGLVWGFFIPETPFPRLAMTAHIQFEAEGAMVLMVGLLLNSKPFPKSDIQLASTLSPLQSRIVLWGCVGTWPVLLSEVANSWWGTKAALPILYAAGVPNGWTATQWQEFIVTAAHYGGGPILVTAMGIVVYALFTYPGNTISSKQL